MDTRPTPRLGIEADIARLESGIKKLKVQYDMFFNGGLAREPQELRTEIENLIRRYQHTSIHKYHHRFHFNALVSRYNCLSELWGRTVRTLEEGDRRAPGADDEPRRRERLLARCRIRDPEDDDEALRGLYSRFLEARQKIGAEKRPVTYEKFLQSISGQTRRLQKSSGCAEIELRLVTRDQKVQLKARPGR